MDGVALIGLLAAAGCALMTPADVATKKEVLSAVPTDLPHAANGVENAYA